MFLSLENYSFWMKHPPFRILLEAISKKRPSSSPSNLKGRDLEMKMLKDEERVGAEEEEEEEEMVEEEEEEEMVEEEKRACLPKLPISVYTSASLSAVRSDV